MSTDRPPPLSGIKVLDLGRVYQGPWCGLLLALAGAEVLKIEGPWGEPARQGAGPGRQTVPFAMLNSNKHDVTLNLKSERGRELFLRMVDHADVVVENFAPGTMDNLGIGPDRLLERNPGLIYGAATGYGVEGPDRDALAMDITVQAHMGVMSVTGFPGGPPVKAGVAFADFLGGTHLYAGVVTALFERERTGRGRIVDVAMADTVFPTLASNLSGYYRDGVAPRVGNGHGGAAVVPYNVYPAADGHVAIIVITEQQWNHLCTAMDQPALAADERFASHRRRYRHAAELDDIIGRWTSARPREEVVAILKKARVPVAAVRGVDEVVGDPHLHERGAIQTVEHPEAGQLVVPHSPLRFRGTPLVPLRPSPPLGRDNEAVFCGELGLSKEELEELRAEGVI